MNRSMLALMLLGCSAPLTAQSPARPGPHPLDPLSRRELEQAVSLLKQNRVVNDATVLVSVALSEPPKARVLSGAAIPRSALAVVYDYGANRTSEILIDLDQSRVAGSKVVTGVQPMFMPRDNERANEIVRRDSTWRTLLRARGVNPDTVTVGGYPIGVHGPAGATDRMAMVWAAGIKAYLNLTQGRVYRTVDAGGPGPGEAVSPYRTDSPGATRPPLPELIVSQPNGRGFQLSGHEVTWDNWRFRIGLAPRGGLALYQVGYQLGGALRPVLYKASLAELWVPYGDRGQHDFYLNAYDAGEVGIARYGDIAMSPADCPSQAEFVPATVMTFTGEIKDVERAFCLYERDGGTAWRHGEDGRRQRQLVLSSVFRVDNYDYGTNWIFSQDGSLELEVVLTGMMNARPTQRTTQSQPWADSSYSTLVAPRVEAMYHQHFFSFRLDLDVGGPSPNSVVEMNAVSPPKGPANPHGNAIMLRESVLATEAGAQRDLNLASHRFWRVLNTDVHNGLGQPIGYALLPGENAVPYAQPGTRLLERSGYAKHHLWVTPYDDAEQHPAGDYVYQSAPGQGLPAWTRRNRSLRNTDVVAWYTLGITHIPRPEDWPIMPVHRAGFKLVPFGSFGPNPALDLPKPGEIARP
ncbi:MAG: nickel transporter [Gemmatimonadota bacterium]